MGNGDECVKVLLISKLCGVFSFTLRRLYPSERACGNCWMGGWPRLKAVVHVVSKLLKVPSFVGTAVAQWLRYCATNRKVPGSIPDGVMEFFIDINPSDRTMALGSTQPLTEIRTRCIS
jgi:hypothetical protein